MQNLTLPTSQTLALGNTLNSIDAAKSGVNINQFSDAPNISFETMLKNQVKAQKTIQQDKNAQQNTAQKNINKNASLNQKQPVKAEQNDALELQTSQTDVEMLETNVSIAQMLDTAKAILADKKTEDASEESLFNVANQVVQPQDMLMTSSPNLGIAHNGVGLAQSSNIDINHSSSEMVLLDSNNKPIKPAVLTAAIGVDESTALQDKDMNLDAKDLPEDRLIWASVSASKIGQNLNTTPNLNLDLNANLNQTNNKSMLDSPQILDAASSLNMPAQQQNMLTQPNLMLPISQLGSSNQIDAYPGKTGWDQAISQKIVWMVGALEQTATLSLNPPELGPLQVVINVSNNTADTTFISNNAEVRQALQDGMGNLRDKMAESGIQLGQANVNSGGRPQQEFTSAFSSPQSPKLSESNAQTSLSDNNQIKRVVQINNGLVDTFA